MARWVMVLARAHFLFKAGGVHVLVLCWDLLLPQVYATMLRQLARGELDLAAVKEVEA